MEAEDWLDLGSDLLVVATEIVRAVREGETQRLAELLPEQDRLALAQQAARVKASEKFGPRPPRSE